jgi:nicotinate-nucleotide pyrophosphorylase (carboxylating)
MTAVHADPRETIFAGIADRTYVAELVAEDEGIVSPVSAAVEAAQELGLEIDFALPEAGHVRPGDEILRFHGTPMQIALAEERVVGLVAKASGIATAARRFVDRALGTPRIVSGAWKKLPMSVKDTIRAAIVAGGAEPRIATGPFVYLDKNFVTMLGGPEPTLAAVEGMRHYRKVIQIDDPKLATAVARAGADVVFVDTGRLEDAAIAARQLRDEGLRDSVELAFGGGVRLDDIDELKRLDVDTVDVGRAIVDAPLLDMRVRVRKP